jgi:hypothetical protein
LLREVRIDDLSVDNVRAAVLDDLGRSMLGTSFLRRLKGFEVHAGMLTIDGYGRDREPLEGHDKPVQRFVSRVSGPASSPPLSASAQPGFRGPRRLGRVDLLTCRSSEGGNARFALFHPIWVLSLFIPHRAADPPAG